MSERSSNARCTGLSSPIETAAGPDSGPFADTSRIPSAINHASFSA